MAVGLPESPQLAPVPGIRLGTAAAAIRKPGRPDLLVLEIAPGANAAAVFTRNRFCAAPVHVARQHLSAAGPRYCLINAGNANAGTGTAGHAAAMDTCTTLARLADCSPENILPFSTGVIGELLPVDRMLDAMPRALSALQADGWLEAARAIMTTDTVPKGCSMQFEVDGRQCTLTGIVKGSGMIRPDMATMLAFIATDAAMEKNLLQQCLDEAVNRTLNRISVDGDTSTNDACLLIATGASGGVIKADSPDLAAFRSALLKVCTYLAQAVVRDGEGATRFVTITVENGMDEAECCRIAYAIAESPLVKTALYAGDPNWGRILAAVGRSGPADLDVNQVTIHLDELCLARSGSVSLDYEESRAQSIMSGQEYTIRVQLGRGSASATIWTCDLSYDYVRINAEYRT